MVEIAGTPVLPPISNSHMTDSESSIRTCVEWVARFCNELRALEEESGVIAGSGYVSLTDPNIIGPRAVYGRRWLEMKKLKRRYDGEGVFRNAIPRLDMLEIALSS